MANSPITSAINSARAAGWTIREVKPGHPGRYWCDTCGGSVPSIPIGFDNYICLKGHKSAVAATVPGITYTGNWATTNDITVSTTDNVVYYDISHTSS